MWHRGDRSRTHSRMVEREASSMRILAHSKYDLGDHVDYKDGHPTSVHNTSDHKEGTGVIRSVLFGKHRHYRPEVVTISYSIEPDDMIGFEHDDEVEVTETSVIGLITEQKAGGQMQAYLEKEASRIHRRFFIAGYRYHQQHGAQQHGAEKAWRSYAERNGFKS